MRKDSNRIVILDGYTENPGDLSWEEFEKYGSVAVYDRTKPEETAERIGNAEIVLTNKTVLDESIMAQCPGLKYIGVLATGFNVVDVAAADVLSVEPPVGNPLLDAPNMLITPHIAWASREARQRLMRMAEENLQAFLEGAPVHVVS